MCNASQLRPPTQSFLVCFHATEQYCDAGMKYQTYIFKQFHSLVALSETNILIVRGILGLMFHVSHSLNDFQNICYWGFHYELLAEYYFGVYRFTLTLNFDHMILK
jgi:hypothetical protein